MSQNTEISSLVCECGKRVAIRTSWTDDNPGRRYRVCQKYMDAANSHFHPTFTKAVFEAVSNAFSAQVTEYRRAPEVESVTGLKPCFDITGHKDLRIPKMELHFKGGAEMVLPLENYFFVVDDDKRSALCLTVVTDDSLLGPDLVSEPSVILGNFLMQNFHVEYDLRNERFGFTQQSCS